MKNEEDFGQCCVCGKNTIFYYGFNYVKNHICRSCSREMENKDITSLDAFEQKTQKLKNELRKKKLESL